jgi:tetratricopeptide (TPR) repeat protein
LISATVLLSACGSTLKQNWRNFTAYYNTYYNAKRAYQTGIEQVEEQSVNINPEQPIRIHTAPVGAGQQNFQKAITKGAKILRKYPNTKWVDNALSLIGKSYYYRQEYFSAEQKFRELYANANSPKMKQRAVLWRGRIFMEMELYSQGISYLQNELGDIENWNKSVKAEVQSVMAELYSYLNQWEPANEYLVESIPQLND